MKKCLLLHVVWKGRWSNYACRCSSTTVKVQMDPRVQELLESSEMHPKRHPGALRNVHTELPLDIKEAMVKTMGGMELQTLCKYHSINVHKKNLVKDAEVLSRYLHARKPPMEEEAEHELASSVRKEVVRELDADLTNASEEDLEHYNKVVASKVQNIIRQRKYNWQQIDFTRHKGLTYMVSRSAREYVVNHQVLKELKNRFGYSPQRIFDFGSGVGSVLWAADSLWPDMLKEAFAVDASSHMNEISRDILTHADRKTLKKILFQRQFLPTSSNPNYDLVVSSYSLLELPSVNSRLEVVNNLWQKTKDFLVLIEFGTVAGFQVINEAREFLLWGMRHQSAGPFEKGHIVSPCPHDLICPLKANGDQKPCNFSATYTTYPQTPHIRKELYSYVIFKKGNKSSDEPNWPRVIRPILLRHKHCICRMCTPEGKLSEVFFTPTKHGKTLHQCARQSKWGDRLPISIQEVSEDSEPDRKPQNEVLEESESKTKVPSEN